MLVLMVVTALAAFVAALPTGATAREAAAEPAASPEGSRIILCTRGGSGIPAIYTILPHGGSRLNPSSLLVVD
jgi:hypothetical protein